MGGLLKHGVGIDDHDDRVAEQLDQAGGLAEQRQVVVPAGKRLAASQLLDPRRRVDSVGDPELFETLRQILRVDLPAAEQTQRSHPQLVERVARALTHRIEPTQRLDLVAEHVEPHRLLLPRRKQIEHAAAHRVDADLGDEIAATKADLVEVQSETLDRMLLAHPQGQHEVLELALEGQPLEQRPRRADDTRPSGAQRAIERGGLPGTHRQRRARFLVRGERRGRKVRQLLGVRLAEPARASSQATDSDSRGTTASVGRSRSWRSNSTIHAATGRGQRTRLKERSEPPGSTVSRRRT